MARAKLIDLNNTPKRVEVDKTYPSDISGLELWLRADGIDHLSDGGSIDYWRDDSQNGNHCYQGTAANRPTWNKNQLNGYPTVSFDGTNDELQAYSPDTPILKHSFVVFKYNDGASWDTYDGILSGTSAADGNDVRILGDGATNTELWEGEMNIPGGGFVHIDGATSHDPDLGDLTAWHILSVHDASATAMAGNYQLAHDRQNAGRYANCEMAEVIGYSAELSAANELIVVTYLNNKYKVF